MVSRAVPPGRAVIPAQASSDEGMVRLWLDSFRSAATRRGYGADWAAFAAAVPLPLRKVTVRDLQEFAASLGGLSPASAARRLSAVKSLFSLACRLGYLPFDVGIPIRLPIVRDTLAERIMTEWQVQRLLELERDPRNGPLLRLIYGAGLRISEVTRLRWKDMAKRNTAGQVTVLGKGGKTRAILLPAKLWNRIAALRGRAGKDAPVFRSAQGGPLQASQVHRIMKRAARRAGVPSASAHWLRHAHVSHALDRGAPVHVVRSTVGHASLETTSRYSHARPDDSSARYLTV